MLGLFCLSGLFSQMGYSEDQGTKNFTATAAQNV